MVDAKKSGDVWENEFGRVPLNETQCNGLDKIIKRIGHAAFSENKLILPEALSVEYFIKGEELCVNMSNGTVQYASADGKFLLQTVSDPITSCTLPKPPASMWTIVRAANLEVLLRSRRMVGLPSENDVCPHCLFSCPCLRGAMDWREESTKTIFASITMRHFDKKRVLPNGDELVTELHVEDVFRVRAAIFEDLQRMTIIKCPEMKLPPFYFFKVLFVSTCTTSNEKKYLEISEMHVANYMRCKNMKDLYQAMVAQKGPDFVAKEMEKQTAMAKKTASKKAADVSEIRKMLLRNAAEVEQQQIGKEAAIDEDEDVISPVVPPSAAAAQKHNNPFFQNGVLGLKKQYDDDVSSSDGDDDDVESAKKSKKEKQWDTKIIMDDSKSSLSSVDSLMEDFGKLRPIIVDSSAAAAAAFTPKKHDDAENCHHNANNNKTSENFYEWPVGTGCAIIKLWSSIASLTQACEEEDLLAILNAQNSMMMMQWPDDRSFLKRIQSGLNCMFDLDRHLFVMFAMNTQRFIEAGTEYENDGVEWPIHYLMGLTTEEMENESLNLCMNLSRIEMTLQSEAPHHKMTSFEKTEAMKNMERYDPAGITDDLRMEFLVATTTNNNNDSSQKKKAAVPPAVLPSINAIPKKPVAVLPHNNNNDNNNNNTTKPIVKKNCAMKREQQVLERLQRKLVQKTAPPPAVLTKKESKLVSSHSEEENIVLSFLNSASSSLSEKNSDNNSDDDLIGIEGAAKAKGRSKSQRKAASRLRLAKLNAEKEFIPDPALQDVDTLIKLREEEAKIKKAAEEEAAKIKKAAEEEAAKIKKAADEEEAKIKKATEEEEEAKIKKAAEDEAAARKKQEEVREQQRIFRLIQKKLKKTEAAERAAAEREERRVLQRAYEKIQAEEDAADDALLFRPSTAIPAVVNNDKSNANVEGKKKKRTKKNQLKKASFDEQKNDSSSPLLSSAIPKSPLALSGNNNKPHDPNETEDEELRMALQESVRINAIETQRYNAALILTKRARMVVQRKPIMDLYDAAELLFRSRFEFKVLARRWRADECAICLHVFKYVGTDPMPCKYYGPNSTLCSHMLVCQNCINQHQKPACFCGSGHPFERNEWNFAI